MAVTMKQEGYTFFEKIGLPEYLISAVNQAGLKLQLGFKNIRLLLDGNLKMDMPLPITVNDLMKEVTPKSQKEAVLSSIVSEIHKMFKEKLGKDLGEPAWDIEVDDPVFAGVDIASGPDETTYVSTFNDEYKTKIVSSFKKKPIVFPSPLKKDLSFVEIMALPPVKLANATMLYQPVHGTSPGSKYYVIGISPGGAKLAAKVKQHEVSIRAEGPMLLLNSALKGAGFQDKKTYMSAHFELGDKTVPQRLIGAVLVGTGLEFSTTVPVVSWIKGK